MREHALRIATLVSPLLLLSKADPEAGRRGPWQPNASYRQGPVINSLSPAIAVVGSSGITVAVIGSGFRQNSTIRWQGSDRTTTYVSDNELRSTLTAADLATVGAAQITVFNPGGQGGTSNAVSFTVGNPVPVISNLSPSTAAAGGEPFSLTIFGQNFVAASSVLWRGTSRPTTFVSSTQLTLQVPASDIAMAGPVQVSVLNPAPGGGSTSPLTLPVDAITPVVSQFVPSEVAQNPTAGFDLRVVGTGFVRSSTVQWNGQGRPTSFVSPTELRASIPATDTDTVATFPVRVSTTVPQLSGSPITRMSTSRSYQVVHPVPVATSIGSAEGLPYPMRQFDDLRFLITGSGFTNATGVTVSGQYRSVYLREWNNLKVRIANWPPGPIVFEIQNPSPGGGTTSIASTVLNPIPELYEIEPARVRMGSGAIELTVRGSRFVNGSVVELNGTKRQTTYVSFYELRAAIPTLDLLLAGSRAVRVRNPDPGGTVSQIVTLSIR